MNYETNEQDLNMETEETKIRKAVMPMFEQFIETISPSLNNINKELQKLNAKEDAVDREAEAGIIVEAMSKIVKDLPSKFPTTVKLDQPLIKQEKVEVQQIDYEKLSSLILKGISTLRKQEVTGTVSVKEFTDLRKSFNRLSDLIVETGKREQFPYSKGENIPVAVKDFIAVEGPAKGGVAEVSEKVWLREQYTHTTISGCLVPTRVEKWDVDKKLTEDYEYDANANPVVKTRRLEPSNNVGD